jgi:hypothetical protein
MKMGEYETWMADLSAVADIPRDLLDKTPARVLFRLRVALDERQASAKQLANELRRHLPGDTMLRTLLLELGYGVQAPTLGPYEPKDPIEEGIRRSQRGKE